MATSDRLVDDLRNIFDDARKTSGQVQAEHLLAGAPFVLKAKDGQHEVAFMRDRLSANSYRSICRAIGDELDRLNAEIARLQRTEKMNSLVSSTQRRIDSRAAPITSRLAVPPAAE